MIKVFGDGMRWDHIEPQEVQMMQQQASPQQAAPSTLPPVSQSGVASEPKDPQQPAESNVHDRDQAVEVPATLIETPTEVVDIPDDPTPQPDFWPDNQLGLSQFAQDPLGLNKGTGDETPDVPMSPAPIVREAEAAAAATPKHPAPAPAALVEEMSKVAISTPKATATPQQKQTIEGPIKFAPITPDAAQVWQTLLRRQSIDSIPASAADTPAPARAVDATGEPMNTARPEAPTLASASAEASLAKASSPCATPAPAPAAAHATPPSQAASAPDPEQCIWIQFKHMNHPLRLDQLSMVQEMMLERGMPYYYVPAPASPAQTPAAPSPTPTPSATPTPAEATPTPEPAPAAIAAPAEPLEPGPISAVELMKMNAEQLKARLDQVQKTKAFEDFVQGCEPSVVEDPLKALLLFDAWMQQHGTPAPAPSAPPPAASTAKDDAGDDGETMEEKKAARAAYMRYYRSVRSAKVPAAVAVKFREACQDKTGKLAAELFAAYMESGENWLSSSIVMEESQAHQETEGGKWGWMTNEEARLFSIVFSKMIQLQDEILYDPAYIDVYILYIYIHNIYIWSI